MPQPIWAKDFALEQPLHVVTIPCSASGNFQELIFHELSQQILEVA
jgi:hypothetical protein